MKYFFSILIAVAGLNLLAQPQGTCGQFHRKYCTFDSDKSEKWQYNAQSKSGLFSQGMVSKLRCVIYKDMDYRISVCCETNVLGDKVNYKIFDARTKELLFDNQTAEDT